MDNQDAADKAQGEWTAEKVDAFAQYAPQPWTKALAMEINAALAAAYAKGAQHQHGEDKQAIEFAEQQLTADREKIDGNQEFWDACKVGYEHEIQQLREQLAAAVEAWTRLKHELTAYDMGFVRRNGTLIAPLDTALAKIGET